MLTLEKSFLEQTVEQMKRNHQDELTAMVSLYELVKMVLQGFFFAVDDDDDDNMISKN